MSDAVTFWIVKGTLGLLVLFSAVTWTVLFAKAVQQWRLARQNDAFVRAVPSTGGRLPTPENVRTQSGPTARVAEAGLEAWRGWDGGGSLSEEVEVRTDVLERSLRRQIQRERRGIESGLAILASIGSTSPFVGLFGTVLGIIHALSRISSLGSASLDVVAGPIGEALAATGIGIAVAVPAVLAYNFFIRRSKSLVADLEDYASGFVNSAITGAYGRGGRYTGRPDDESVGVLSVAQEAGA